MAYLYPPRRLPDSLYVRLFEVQRRALDRSWNAVDVCSSYWRLYANNRDGASLSWSGGRYPLTAGEVHLVPAWVAFSCHNDTVLEHFFIHFDVVGLAGAVVRDVFDRPRSLGAPDDLRGLIRELPDGVSDDDLAALCRAKAAVELALAHLFEGLDARQVARCRQVTAARRPVAAALQHIEDHLAEPLSNGLLAGLCRMSEDHFVRRFRECVGQTPAQYVLERRVATAAQLLVFGDDSIERVAAAAGFANRHYFTRVFARRMGVPPAAYRRGNRL